MSLGGLEVEIEVEPPDCLPEAVEEPKRIPRREQKRPN